MAKNWKPWDTYPGLTQERLSTAADIIRVAREETADDHRPEKFETNWSLGVRGYERTCGALTWAQQEYPWLTVASGAGGGPVHFVLRIGGHPVRFFKGDPDDIPTRYSAAKFCEIAELERMFALDSSIPVDRCLRISIGLDTDGRPMDIYLIEIDEQTSEVTNMYSIPALASNVRNIADFAPQVPPADLPPVSAEPVANEGTEQKNAKKTGSDNE